MLTVAPVLRQMNSEELAEYQVFSAVLGFGALALGCGIVLALACLRWATRRHALRALARWSRLLGTAYGVMLGLSGLGAALSLLIAGEGGGNTSVIEYTIWLTAMVFWGLAPGVILTYHGISSSVGEGSSAFHVPPASWMIVGWVPTLALGWWIMRRDVPLAAPMPLLDVAAVALPAVALVSMAWRGSPLRGKPGRGQSWRHVTLAAAISMTVGVQVAIYVESLGSFTGVVLMLVHNGAFANVRDSDGFFRTLGDSNVILSRNEQFFANLITASVCAPLIEEFGKGLGVRFLLRRDTTRSQAFVLGAAAGAGFAVLETLLYAVPNPGVSGPGEWGPTMLIRAGGLHILNTAVIGLAWWYAVNGHRPRRAWLLFGLAVFNHAAWNTFATVLDARILGLDTLSNRTLEIAAYSVLGAVSVCYITAIPAIARRLRRLDATAPVSGELALMSPWLGG
jgi:RsiW-degrading membrane proteinase PrsW (M82 family)